MTTLDDLRRAIVESRRSGRVHVVQRSVDAPASSHEAASDLVRSLGWRPPRAWTEVDRDGAIEVVSTALMNDLVDDGPRMPFRDAEARAREFVADCAAGSVFFTNGALEETRMGFGRSRITQGRADAGVIAVSPTELRMLWIEDGSS